MKKKYIYGIRPIIEAINSNVTIDKIFIKKGLNSNLFKELKKLIVIKNITSKYVPIEKLNRLTNGNHQGVFAFTSIIENYNLDYIIPYLWENNIIPLILILYKINDTRNLGAIIRSAECFNVNCIIISKKDTAEINENTVKTSCGAIYNIPICKVNNINDTIKYLENYGIQIISTSSNDSYEFPFDIDLSLPSAIILGNEEKGLPKKIIENSHKIIKLPIFGKTKSLNVSVSAGAVLYEITRQRINKNNKL